MYSFEDIGTLLDSIVDSLPSGLFYKLNGGVNLVYSAKHNYRIPSEEYWVMGEYCCDKLGRRIYLYYGSFMALYIDASPDEMSKQLRKTVLHELRHHLEGLAGVRDLEIEDEIYIQKALMHLGK